MFSVGTSEGRLDLPEGVLFETYFNRCTRSLAASLVSGMLAMTLFCAAGPSASAQTTGKLTGTVRDITGALVAGANVTLRNVDSKAIRSTISSDSGFFLMTALQPATYDLEVTSKGFDRYRVSGIQIHPGDSLTIETIKMKIGTVEQEMTVSATTAGVNLASPEKSSLITAEDIKRLSTVGRDATD